jgi:hypothetical protein
MISDPEIQARITLHKLHTLLRGVVDVLDELEANDYFSLGWPDDWQLFLLHSQTRDVLANLKLNERV